MSGKIETREGVKSAENEKSSKKLTGIVKHSESGSKMTRLNILPDGKDPKYGTIEVYIPGRHRIDNGEGIKVWYHDNGIKRVVRSYWMLDGDTIKYECSL